MESITLIKGQGPRQITKHLQLATGNFWPAPVEAGGQRERQLTAALFITDLRATPTKNDHVRVHRGQKVEAGGATLEVLEIRATGSQQSVQLQVRPH